MAVLVEQLITPDILKPARYLGNERLPVHKPWDAATIPWVLTYPEVYEVGASNLGHIILYNILNAQPNQLCDRAYLPRQDLGGRLLTIQTPLFALESKPFLTEFDILGFSLNYELGASNILEILDLPGIPLTWRERQEAEDKGHEKYKSSSPSSQSPMPLIFTDGQTATSNPEPYADFFDFIVLGDGEELLPKIRLVLAEDKKALLSREELLLDLGQIPGVYLPQFYHMGEGGTVHPLHTNAPKRILRRVAILISGYSIGLFPYLETVHDRLTIEIRRGCTPGCRFCQPGMLTRPVRDVKLDQVVDGIEAGMQVTGYNEFSLLSLSCSDYLSYLSLPAVGIEINNRLKNENITLSLPSQRVDRFDENIANILGGMHQGSFTFAPEAGTQRMRIIINKGLTNEELLRVVKTAWQQGWDTIKLYFMIGLPGETDADFWAIAETVNLLQQECRVRGEKLLSLNLRISNFTPKPHTPFQWHSVSISELKRKQNLLRQEFRGIGNVKVNFTDIRLSAMEDFIGRGDRSLGKVLRPAWELGATMDSCYDNNVEQAFSPWGTVIAEAGLDWKYCQVRNGEFNLFSVGNGEQETENGEQDILSPITVRLSALNITLPWDHIDTRINKQWLYEDLKLALEAAIVPDYSCEGCSHCGVCGTDFSHNIFIKPPGIPKFGGDVIPNTTKVQRLGVQFGKHRDMALVSHLDLMRLFDRIIGRRGIPVAFTGGFHPHSRIPLASALYLGSTISCEIVDFELTQPMDLGSFREQLISQLPSDILIYHVEEIDLKAPVANQAMQAAKYLRTVSKVGDMTTKKWQEWIEAIKITEELLVEYTTKSGKYQMINLRDRLFDLQLIEAHNSPTQSKAVLHYLGSCRHNGVILRPEQLLSILETVAKAEFHLLHIHSNQLLLEI